MADIDPCAAYVPLPSPPGDVTTWCNNLTPCFDARFNLNIAAPSVTAGLATRLAPYTDARIDTKLAAPALTVDLANRLAPYTDARIDTKLAAPALTVDLANRLAPYTDARIDTKLNARNTVYGFEFNVRTDGTECAAAVRATIAAAVSRGAVNIQWPQGVINVGSEIVLGNGTSSGNQATPSTINGLKLWGSGAPFLRLGITGSLAGVGTIFNWVGPAGGKVFRIAGPASGFCFYNIAINGGGVDGTGAGVAGMLIDMQSHSRGIFENVTLANVQAGGTLLNIGCVPAETLTTGGDQSIISADGNQFRNLRCVVGPNATGVRLDGYPGLSANGWDPLRTSFINTKFLVSLTGGTGIWLGFTDQNTFHDTFFTGFGANNQMHAAIRFVGTPTVPSNSAFPQNNIFSGQTDTGQFLFTTADGVQASIGAGNRILHNTLLDNQAIVRGNAGRYITMEVQERDQFPFGGYLAQLGANITDRAFRNRFRNSQFRRGTASSWPTITNNQELIKGWFLSFNGAPTLSGDILYPPTGNPLVPGARVLRLTCTAVGGMTVLYLYQPTGTVRDTDGRAVTVSATMRLPFGGTNALVGGQIQQYFGTGGSPSALIVTGLFQGDVTLNSNWNRVSMSGVAPRLGSSVLGTDDNDTLRAGFLLPITTFVIDIAAPQFETAPADTAYERLPQWVEKIGADTIP